MTVPVVDKHSITLAAKPVKIMLLLSTPAVSVSVNLFHGTEMAVSSARRALYDIAPVALNASVSLLLLCLIKSCLRLRKISSEFNKLSLLPNRPSPISKRNSPTLLSASLFTPNKPNKNGWAPIGVFDLPSHKCPLMNLLTCSSMRHILSKLLLRVTFNVNCAFNRFFQKPD